MPEVTRLRFNGGTLPLNLPPTFNSSQTQRRDPPSRARTCACSDFPALGHWQQADGVRGEHDNAPLEWVYESCVPQAFLNNDEEGQTLEQRSTEGDVDSSSSILHSKRILFAGASFAIRLLRHAFHVAGHTRTRTMFTRHVTSNVTIDRFHVEWTEWRDARAKVSSLSSPAAVLPSSISFGYTPIRGLFTRNWTTPRDHLLPVDADVIVVDPGLHDVASNTLHAFQKNIPAFFSALASVSRHVVLLLPTATHFDMQGVLAYHRCSRADSTRVPKHSRFNAASIALLLPVCCFSITSPLPPSPSCA